MNHGDTHRNLSAQADKRITPQLASNDMPCVRLSAKMAPHPEDTQAREHMPLSALLCVHSQKTQLCPHAGSTSAFYSDRHWTCNVSFQKALLLRFLSFFHSNCINSFQRNPRHKLSQWKKCTDGSWEAFYWPVFQKTAQ
jgi:hypothetical protein